MLQHKVMPRRPMHAAPMLRHEMHAPSQRCATDPFCVSTGELPTCPPIRHCDSGLGVTATLFTRWRSQKLRTSGWSMAAMTAGPCAQSNVLDRTCQYRSCAARTMWAAARLLVVLIPALGASGS